jgi:hypothetical protein
MGRGSLKPAWLLGATHNARANGVVQDGVTQHTCNGLGYDFSEKLYFRSLLDTFLPTSIFGIFFAREPQTIIFDSKSKRWVSKQ